MIGDFTEKKGIISKWKPKDQWHITPEALTSDITSGVYFYISCTSLDVLGYGIYMYVKPKIYAL